MRIKIISCQIFDVYIEHLMGCSKYSNEFDITYLEIDRHVEPEKLNADLQALIDETTGFDLIILIYGICGNATKGIVARDIRVAIPRVHDCATILLGSKEKHKEAFGHRPSQGWKSIKYNKNDIRPLPVDSNPLYREFVDKYGEDNALYLFETMYPVSEDEVYISLGLDEDLQRVKSLPEGSEVVEGDLGLIDDILNLSFDEVLVLEPGQKVVPVYDMDDVIAKE